MENFEIIETFNTGFYGLVKKIKDKRDNKLKCLKIINKSDFDKSVIDLKKTKFEILKNINIDSTIKLYEYWEDECNLYSVNELFEGLELQKYLFKNKLNLDDIILIIKQICESMQKYLELGLFFIDLRLEKILINDNKIIKIIDNGNNVKIDDLDNNTFKLIDEIYQPPEYKTSNNYEKIIVWNIGIIFHFLWTLKFPFNGPKDKRLKDKFSIKDNSNKYPKELKLIIEKMLDININNRLELKKLIF